MNRPSSGEAGSGDDPTVRTSHSPRGIDSGASAADPVADGRYASQVRALLRAALETEAHTSSALRSAIEARAAAHAGRSDPDPDAVPVALHHFVDTVARNAWKMTDEDVNALKQAGFSEDAIFEITVSAALGAATGRMRQAYDAMKGAD